MEQVFGMITYLIGIAVILWGKRIYKFYLCFMGILLGAGLGFLIGFLIGRSFDAAIVMAFFLGAILGPLALLLHKLYVFIIAGLTGGTLSALIFSVLGLSGEQIITIGLIFFISVGLLVLKFYDHILVIIMAYTGASLIYNSVNFLYMNQSGKVYYYSFIGLLRTLIDILIYNWSGFLYILFLMILFALYFQLRMEVKKEDDIKVISNKFIFRKITYLYASLIIIDLLSNYPIKSEITRFISDIINCGFLNFGFLAMSSFLFIRYIIPLIEKISFIPGLKFKRFLALVIFGLAVIPVISGIIYGILFTVGRYSMTFFEAMVFDYKMLFHETLVVALAKWIFHGLLLPGLLYKIAFTTEKSGEITVLNSLETQ